MKPNVLIIITGDPRLSARPAEALRIAAGVGACDGTRVAVYLRGPAVLALSEQADRLVDEENYTRYRPLLGESSRAIYAERDEPCLGELGEPALPFEAINDDQLARLTAQSDYVLRF
jgi:hypothetical protein